MCKQRFGQQCAVCLFLFILLLGVQAAAEDSLSVERIVPELRAVRINPEQPVIDGILDDEVWNSPKTRVARDFTQRDPDEGEAPTESTMVAVVFDDEAIYCAVWCYDSEPGEIDKQLVRRDRIGESDYIALRLDPYHDHQSGNEFMLTAAGVQADSRIYNDNNTDWDWDGVWDGAVKIHPWGWAAEYRIPYHCLRFTEGEEQVWGMDMARWVNRRNESSRWAFVPKSAGGFAANFGHLTGLSGIKPARHLAILPYMVSNAELEPGSDGNVDGRRYTNNSGFDIKYGLSSNLTLDATINPDFGQVELDQPVLNLSAFETFYSEKRPFFLEGADLFRTDFNLFYSRRIGRPPQGYISSSNYAYYDPDFDYYTDRPSMTTILGAAKLSGKLGGKTSIAFLNAVTQEEKAGYKTVDGEVREGIVEPLANYSVARVKHDLFSRSSIGVMLTSVNQDTKYPAITGGVDWRLYTKGGGYSVRGQTVFSRVDPEHTGFGFDFTAEKNAGEHFRGAFGGTIKDPHFDINRIGYTSRNGIHNGWLWLQWRTQDDWWIIRNSWNNLNLYGTRNYDGYTTGKGGNINSHFEFTNNWSLGGGFNVQGEKYSDVETRGNGVWIWPVYPTYSWWASLNTDQRKKVSFNLNPGSGGDRGGMWWANYVGVQYRPKSNMEFSLGTNYHRTFKGTRWVENRENDNGDYDAIFADLDKDQVSIYLSASVMLSRNLSWRLSGQGLISSLDYNNYRRYIGDNQYASDVEPAENDGTYSALNSTMILRWEYMPGSTLYLVWTRSRPDWADGVDHMEIRDELDRFFSRGATNVWLVKASYWWNI